jgi:hypothetical protein
VSFRLSEEEYDCLKAISETRGARSVSEFTRSVACPESRSENNIWGESNDRIQEILLRLQEQIALIDQAIIRLEKVSGRERPRIPRIIKSQEKKEQIL